MGLFDRKKSDFDVWLESLTYEELAYEYERRRQEWVNNGYGGDGSITPEMKRINCEMRKRTEDQLKKKPHNPNHYWSDANRWEKD